MDILETKKIGEYDADLIKIIKKLQFKNAPIEFKGSASLKSQRYYSDIDLFSQIDSTLKADEIYNEFCSILDAVRNDPNIYFIELKIELKNGRKIRFFKNDTLDKDVFMKYYKLIDFIKIDCITFLVNIFMELSIIYKMSNVKMDKGDYVRGLNEDIKELKKEGRYYKVLKRLFNKFKLDGDTEKLLYLSEVFNSDLGKLYQKISNMEAILKVVENHKDDMTKRRAQLNLKDIGESSVFKTAGKQIERYSKALNKAAKSIYDELIV